MVCCCLFVICWLLLVVGCMLRVVVCGFVGLRFLLVVWFVVYVLFVVCCLWLGFYPFAIVGSSLLVV